MLSTVSRPCSGTVMASLYGMKVSRFLAASNNVLNTTSNGKTNYTTTSGSKCLIAGRSLTMEFGKDRPDKKYEVLKIPVRYSSTGNHVTLWSAERALSAAMVPIIPLAFICPSSTMDYLLALTITIHSHWGIEAIVVDYVRPSVFGNAIPKLALGGVYLLSALTLGGLAYFTYTDVGIVNAIKLLWKL